MSAELSRRIASRLARLFRSVADRLEFSATSSQGAVAPPSVWTPPAMPGWVVDELKELAHIEPELLPADDSVDRFQFYSVPVDSAPGRSYRALINAMGGAAPSHIVWVPWLKAGGADRGAIYHVRAIVEANPEACVLVIATEDADSPWADKLPSGVRFVEFGKETRGLDFNKQVVVAARLLVQLAPHTIHVINSRVGWECIARHGLALTQFSSLYASLFCDDYTSRMVPVGYARDYLRTTLRWMTRVFTDNSEAPKVWARDLGIDASRFTVLPFPYDRPIPPLSRVDAGASPSRVLWAGRLDRQKRPDVLAAIAEAMPDCQFDVWGDRVMGPADPAIERLQALPNVTMHGAFARLEDVVSTDHFAYLHTSAWEGVPTILFDVAAAGLPICAPMVGGIPDFCDREDLVERLDDVDAFRSRLELMRFSFDLRQSLRKKQWDRLADTRRWAHFVERLASIEGYFHRASQAGRGGA